MPVMPYIAIPGLPFLRDITDWYHSSSSITNHNKGLANKGSHDPVLIQSTQRNNIITVACARLHLHGHRQCWRWEMILVVVVFLLSIILVVLLIVWPQE